MRLQRWLPQRIDRYILGEILGPFLGGNVFFLFILLMFQILRLAELFISHNVGWVLLAKMVGLMALSFLPHTLPVAFLIGILVGFGRLSADSELVALKSSGMSLLRMSLAPVLLSLVVSAVSLGLNLDWVPWGERTAKDTLLRVGNTRVVSAIKQGSFNSGFFDLLIFADEVDSKSSRLKKVFIYDERDAKNPLTVTARSGEVVTVRTEKELSSAVVLKLYDGSIHRPGKETNQYQKIDFGEYSLYLSFEEGGGVVGKRPRMFSYQDLLKWIADTEVHPGSGEYIMARTEYWQRVASALIPLIFVFVGMGLATVRTRVVRSGAALTSIVVFAGYWICQMGATQWSYSGRVPAGLAMQAPIVMMCLLAWFAFKRASW